LLECRDTLEEEATLAASLQAGTQVNSSREVIRAANQQAVTQVASQQEGTPADSLEVAIPVRLPPVPELQQADTPEDSLRDTVVPAPHLLVALRPVALRQVATLEALRQVATPAVPPDLRWTPTWRSGLTQSTKTSLDRSRPRSWRRRSSTGTGATLAKRPAG